MLYQVHLDTGENLTHFSCKLALIAYVEENPYTLYTIMDKAILGVENNHTEIVFIDDTYIVSVQSAQDFLRKLFSYQKSINCCILFSIHIGSKIEMRYRYIF
jgi:hypothetical protein